MIIRDARDDDVPALVEIVNAFIATTTIEYREQPYDLADRRAWLARHRSAGEPVLVVELDGQVVGFATYGDFRDASKWPGYRFSVEHTLHVRQPHWGRGVGRALMLALMERARQAGKHVMVAAVDGENLASIHFHLRLGFVEVGRMPEVGFKLGRWLTLVLLQKRLT